MRLKLAIQKSGRLSEASLELLRACGVRLRLHEARLLAHAQGMALDVLRVRDDDIPGLVMDGVVDLGLVGENVLEEATLARQASGEAHALERLRALDFGRCRLSLAYRGEDAHADVRSLEGRRVATSYPQLTRRYLQQQGVQAQVVNLAGSVEVAPRAGLADAICDLVSTGVTLEANGLREGEVIFRSQATLLARGGEWNDAQRELLGRLLRRIDGVQRARESKYIMLHAPTDRLGAVRALLPGSEHPTVLPLAGDPGRVALHAVSKEAVFWDTMEGLEALGCTSILVLPIEKMLTGGEA